MSDSGLPQQPRTLTRATRWGLLLGHTLSLAGVMTLGLGSLVVWLLVAGYNLNFSDLRVGLAGTTTQSGEVKTVTQRRLWTGEPVTVVTASYGDSQVAQGYGPSQLKIGDLVEVVVPPAPAVAWLKGLQRFPVALGTLARLTLFFLTPGLLLVVLGLLYGRRHCLLLRDGEERQVRADKRLPLPRPYKGSYWTRWEAGEQSFWAIIHQDSQETTALTAPSSGAILEVLLPRLSIEEERLSGLSRSQIFRAGLAFVLLSLQALPLGLFLLT